MSKKRGWEGEGKTDANSKFFIFGLRSNLSSDNIISA